MNLQFSQIMDHRYVLDRSKGYTRYVLQEVSFFFQVLQHTVWKFKKFSANVILHEIAFSRKYLDSLLPLKQNRTCEKVRNICPEPRLFTEMGNFCVIIKYCNLTKFSFS